MNILLLGKDGQVGWELQRTLLPFGNIHAFDRNEANLEKSITLQKLIEECKPKIIINAAAYTAVEHAGTQPSLAKKINSDALKLLASIAKHHDAWLIHYSTDYVFDGKKPAPYVETDIPNPLNVYGSSKLENDIHIQNSGCKYLIFRTSWPLSPRRSNFVRTILKLLNERDELKIVADQFGSPTRAKLIADITALAIGRIKYTLHDPNSMSGLYNLSSSGTTTWHGIAQYIVNNSEIFLRKKIIPLRTQDYPSAALHPLNSSIKFYAEL